MQPDIIVWRRPGKDRLQGVGRRTTVQKAPIIDLDVEMANGWSLQWLRKDPGRVLLWSALVATALVYAPTLGRGIVNYDDTWLIADNQVLQHLSLQSLWTVFTDLDSGRRIALGAEYLPVRDLTVMADFALWGNAYGGFHLTNLVIYLLAITAWFYALEAWGIDRRVCGLAVLLWALHPSHAESVAWLTERKGLLAAMFAGGCAFSYARFRVGRSTWYLPAAMALAVLAVWSKAPAVFAVAALAGLELVLPGRLRWRRSIMGLGAIGAVAAAAFVPVLMLAVKWSIVGSDLEQPASRLAMVLGVHGFYIRLGTMTLPNAVSYPLSTAGPAVVDLALGAIGLCAALFVLVAPRRKPWAPSAALRAAAVIWLFAWLPVSHAILPIRTVFVADRYLLIPSLGLALAAAVAISRVASANARVALIAAIAFAATLRTLDASASWQSPESLWERAVTSNPNDGMAWSMYLEALEESGQTGRADAVVARGLEHTSSPRLVMHDALMRLRAGDRVAAMARMIEAAGGGEPRAMANLALLLLRDGRLDEALVWARLSTLTHSGYVHGHRVRGKVALAAGKSEEALAAFAYVLQIEPDSAPNRMNVAMALIELRRPAEARPHLEACVGDPQVGAHARSILATLPK